MRRKKNTVLQLQDTDRLTLILEDLAARGERQVGNALRRLNIHSQDPFDTPELKPYEEPVQDYQDEQEEDFVQPTQQSPKSSSPNSNQQAPFATTFGATVPITTIAGSDDSIFGENTPIKALGLSALTKKILPKNPIQRLLTIGGVKMALEFAEHGPINWAKNAWNSYGEDKNKAEIGDSQGNILTAREKQMYLDAVQRFQDNNSDLLQAQQLLAEHPEQSHAILDRISHLLDLNYELLPKVKAASTYSYPTNNDDRVIFGATTPMSINIGNSTSIQDDIKYAIDTFEHFDWLGSPTADKIKAFRDNIKNTSDGIFKYNQYVNDTLIPEMSKRIEEDTEDLKGYHVDDWFRKKAEAAKGTMYLSDVNTYLYGLPGVMGSSASNNGLQYASSALKIAASAAAFSGAGAPLSIPLAIAGTAVGVASGEHENYAEVANNYMDALTKKLNVKMPDKNQTYLQEFVKEMSDDPNDPITVEEAFNRFVLDPSKVKNQEIQRIAASQLLGLNNLFANDMTAVVGSEILETGISLVVPLGGKIISSVTKPGYSFAAKRALVNFAKRHPYAGKPIKFLALATSEVSPGTTGSMTYDLVKGTLKTAAKKPINNVTQKLGQEILRRSAYAMENPGLYLSTTTGLKKGTGFIASQLGLGFAEAIEEGKQHQHGDAYAKGEFEGDQQGLLDLLQNDLSTEARGAMSFLGSTLLGLYSDPQLLAEMRGGFLAPYGNAMTLVNTYSRFGDVVTDIKTTNLAANSVMSLKFDDRLLILNAIQYAKTARSQQTFNYLESAFDKMSQLSEDLQRLQGDEYDGFTKEDIEEQRKRFHETYFRAIDPKTMAAAEKRGIKIGSDDYDTFVAMLQYGSSMLYDAADKVSNIQEAIDNVRNNLIVSEDNMLIVQSAPLNMVQSILNSSGAQITINPENLYDQEDVDEVDVAAQQEARQSVVNELNSKRNQISNLAYLQALLARINALEQLPDRTERQNEQLGFFRERFLEAKQKAKIVGVETQEDLDKLIDMRYKKDIDDLTELYKTRLLHEADVDQASRFLHILKGTVDIQAGILDNETVLDIIRRVNREATLSKEAVDKSIKARTKQILDKYKNSIRQDLQYVQYIYDAFDAQKKAIEDRKRAVEEEAIEEETAEQVIEEEPDVVLEVKPESQPTPEEKPTYDFSDEEMDEMIRQVQSEYEIYNKPTYDFSEQEMDEMVALAQAEYETRPNKKERPSAPITPKLRTLDALAKIRVDGESIIKTGKDYFVDENGVIKRYPRVHSVKESMYDDAAEVQLERNKLEEELQKLYDTDKTAFKAKVLELQNEYNKELEHRYGKTDGRYDIYSKNVIDLSPYLTDAAIKDPGIVSQIAKLVFYRRMKSGDPILNVAKRSVIAGTIVDDISREVLSGTNITYSTEYGMPEDVFNRYVEQLKQQKAAYERDGWTIVTDPLKWHGTVQYKGKPVEVAGETDMLLVNEDGDIKLVDFKTSKKPFTPVYKWTKLTAIGSPVVMSTTDKSQVPDGVEVKVEYPALDEQLQGAKFTTRQDYTTQLATFYKQLIDLQMHGIAKVVGIELLPTRVKTKSGKNALGHTDYTVFGGFASSSEQVEDDLRNNTDYLELSAPILITPSEEEGKDLPPQIIENHKQLNLDTLNGQINSVKDLQKQLLEAIKAHGESLPDDVKNALANLETQHKLMAARTKQFMEDADQRSNPDTLSQLEKDMNAYINRLLDAVNYINSTAVMGGIDVTQPRFVARMYQTKFDMEKATNINWGMVISRPYGKELARVAALPDFLETAIFEIDIPSWNRRRFSPESYKTEYVTVYYTEHKPNGTVVNHIFGSNKEGLVPIELQTKDILGNDIWRLNLPLVQQINALLANPANRGRRIFIKPSNRTNGVVDYNGTMRNAVDALDILNTADLFNGNSGGVIGVTIQGNVRLLSKNSSRYGEVVHGFSASDGGMQDGIMVYVKYMHYSEDGNDFWKHDIPIPLTPKLFSATDVDFIISCLQNWGKQRTIKINGKEYKSPLTNRQLLTLLVRFGPQSEKTNSRFIFLFAQNPNGVMDKNVVLFGGIKTDENNYSDVLSYDLRIPQQVEALKNELRKISVYYNAEPVLFQSTATNTTEHKLSGLSQFFKDNSDIDEIKFSDSLQFNRSDVDPDGDGSFKGTSILNWMLKSGWMMSSFNGISMPHIFFDRAEIDSPTQPPVDNSSQASITNVVVSEPDVTIQSIDDWRKAMDDIGDSNDDDGLNKRLDKAAVEPLDIELAKKRIARILGKNFPVEYVDGFINNTHGVVGRLKLAAITLSSAAQQGVEFHESFHAVLEYLVGEKRRARIYDHYRNRYGKGRTLTDRQVTEELADLFMEFKNGISINSHELLDTFRLILRWVRAVYKLSDIRLATLFTEASLGVFSRRTISEQQVKLFEQRFGKNGLDYDYTTRSGKKVSLKNFANFNQLRDQVDRLLYQIVNKYGIDPLARNVYKLSTDKASVIKTLGNVYDILTAKMLTSEQIAQLTPAEQRDILMTRELFEKWDEMTREIIDDTLESFGLHSRRISAAKKNEDKNAGESAVAEDIEGHSDDFWSRSRSEGASAGIHYLFSTIPALRYATTQDISNGEIDNKGNKVTSLTKVDKKGKERKVLVSTKKNALGRPKFMSFDEVYQTLLKSMYKARSVAHLDEMLAKAAENDYMFDRIFTVFHSQRYRSYVRQTQGEYKGVPIVMLGGKQLDPKFYIKDPKNLTDDEKFPTKIVAVVDFQIGDEVIHAGQEIPNALILTNPDAEALVTQMFLSIKSQKLDFRFTFSNNYVDESGKEQKGRFTYRSDSTNTEQAQAVYPHTWFDNLRSLVGAVLNGQKPGPTTPMQQSSIALRDLVTGISSINEKVVKINGVSYDYNTPEGFDAIVTEFISNLNKVGISIERQMLNYMLMLKYPELDMRCAFLEFLSSREVGTINTLIGEDGVLMKLHNALLKKDTNLFLLDIKRDLKKNTQPSGAYLYGGNSFIRELSLWYGRYKAASQEMRLVGPNNTDMYLFAENHTASDIVDEINNVMVDEHGVIEGSDIIKDLVYQENGSFAPVYYNSHVVQAMADGSDQTDEFAGKRIGSVIIKSIMQPGYVQNHQIVLSTHAGMKSDQRADGGRKYVEITEREDYLSKADLLSQGYIVFPTLADKSTWFYLRGIFLPGLKWINGVLSDINTDMLPGIGMNGNLWFSAEDSAKDVEGYAKNQYLDQLIEYARCDYANALFVWQQLKSELIPDEHKVKNFHKGNQQGARLAFMLGIYDEKGHYISFNNNKRSPEKDHEIAYKHFFSKSAAEQRKIIARTLQHRLEEELEYLAERGIIVHDEVLQGKFPKMLGYKNKYLDAEKIQLLKQVYKSKKIFNGTTLDKFFTDGLLEALAIIAYVNDINARSVMSQLETQRIFTGMPHEYKWVYNDETGDLMNVRDDESKRYGGLGSTGTNNRIDLPNISEAYTCAEIEDWEIASPIASILRKAFIHSELLGAVLNKRMAELLRDRPWANDEDKDAIYDAVYESDLTDEKMQEELGDIAATVIANADKMALSYDKKINVADGTAFITDKMAENLLRQRGAYTKDVQAAFNYLRGDKKSSTDPLSDPRAYKIIHEALLSTQKYSAFGFRKEYGIPVHYYDKFALFPLFDSIAYGFTHDLYQKMKDSNVDMLMFTSAVKVGSEGALKFDPTMDAEQVSNFSFNGHTYKQRYQFIRRQLNTDPREEETMAMGTQAAKVALAVLRNNKLYGSIRGRDLRDRLMANINELAKNGAERLRAQFLGADGELDLEKFSAFVRSELVKRNADKNILDALEIVYDKDADGKIIKSSARFAADLNAVSNMQWIESIITSKINSEIVDITLPGNAYYQRSVFGMEGSPMHNVSEDDIKDYQINNGNPLQLINDEGSMDAVISIDYFMHLIPKDMRYDFKKARQWLIDQKVIGSSPDVHANTMAYRIPTQAPASVHAIRFVDVLPVVRDTIVFPKEFTKLTGSDFDIDKQYLSTLNYKLDENGNVTTEFEQGSDKYLQNQILLDYLLLLKQNGVEVNSGQLSKADFINSLKRSVDNDTELITGDNGVLTKIERNRTTEQELPMKYGCLSTQVGIKNAFITGKSGIAPFALNNNSLILTQLYDVAFTSRDDGILTWLNMESLGKYTDRDGNSILSWIGAMINAHVDVAKDPYVLRLNVNKYTWNLLNLLMRTGFGDDAFYFVRQPVMTVLAEESENSNGVIVDDPTASPTERQRLAERNVLLSMYNGWAHDKTLYGILDRMTDPNTPMKTRLKQDAFISVYLFLFGVNADGSYKPGTVTPLEDILTNPKALIDPKLGITLDNLSTEPMYEVPNANMKLSPRDVQAYVAMAKMHFDVYASAMADLVNATKIDTKKLGINYQDQLEYRKKYNELILNPMFTRELIDMLDKSFIDTKTNLALEALPQILGKQLIQYTMPFLIIISETQIEINNRTTEARNAIKKGLFSYIKQSAMNTVMDNLHIEFLPMILGNNTMASRLIQIKNKLLQNTTGDYADFVSGGKFINALLDNLDRIPHQTPYGQPMYDILGLNNSQAIEQSVKNQYIDDWMLLYESSDPELSQFARDLAIYAFMMSADNAGFTTFFKYVPLKIRQDIGYVQEIHDTFTRFKNLLTRIITGDYDLFIDPKDQFSIKDFIRCNWRNYNICPVWNTTTYGKHGPYSRILASMDLTYLDMSLNDNGDPVYIGKNMPRLFVANIRQKNDRYPMFLKIRRQNASKYDANPYILYEYVGQVGRNKPVYSITRQPGLEIMAGSSRYTFYENNRQDNYPSIFTSRVFDRQQEWFLDQVEKLARYILDNPTKDDSYSLAQYKQSGISPYQNEVYDVSYIEEIYSDDSQYDRTYTEEIKIIRDAALLRSRGLRGVEQDGNVSYHNGDWTRTEAEQHPEILYIFTDNTDRDSGSNPVSDDSWYAFKYGKGHHYPGTTQAVLRGLPNAYPVSTQHWYHEGAKGPTGVWTDEYFDEFKAVVDDEFKAIMDAWDTGRYTTIMLGKEDGFVNSSISKITESRTPKIYTYIQSKTKELIDYVNGESSDKTPLQIDSISEKLDGTAINVLNDESTTTINIYAGTGENTDLSNFAERPIDITVGEILEIIHRYVGKAFKAKFKTVEGAFQAMKIFFSNGGYSGMYVSQGGLPTIGITNKGDQMITKFENASGSEARLMGRQIEGLNTKKWDEVSSIIMKALIKASFEQNPQALQRLLATGNATLTHTQDRGKWGTEFPRLLMEVREELKDKLLSTGTAFGTSEETFDDFVAQHSTWDIEFSDEAMKNCKN